MKLRDRLIVILITVTMFLSGTGVSAFADTQEPAAGVDEQVQAVPEEAPEKSEDKSSEEEKAVEQAPAKAEEKAEVKSDDKAEASEENAAKAEEIREEAEESRKESAETGEEVSGTAEDASEELINEEAEDEEAAVEGTLTKTITIDGVKTYIITVDYKEDAGIPEGAELKVSEVSGKEYKSYLNKAADTLDVDVHSIAYARTIDISIVKGGREFQPNDKVKVTVELKDAEDIGNVQVIHFEETAGGSTVPEELSATTSGKKVSFETEGFSCFSFVDCSLNECSINADTDVREGRLYENDDIILTGRMPAQGIVEAKRVDVEIEGQNTLVAYDIKIYADELMKEQGINWQPGSEPVTVTVKSDAINSGKVNIYHMADENSKAELVAGDVAAKDGSVTFKAASFSVYPVTENSEKPRIFYTFYNGDTALAAEYITEISEFYDPGVSPEYGQTFLGWAFDPAETDESRIYSFDELKAQLEATLSTRFADGTEIKVYAKFMEAYYLRYMVNDGEGNVGVLKSESVRADASNRNLTVNCEYSAAGENFEGWINAADGEIYQNGSRITLNGHIDLYAKVDGRHWLVFNANTTGATFTGPQLIHDEYVTVRPEDPAKKGYVFKGWNTKADGSGVWWYKAGGFSVNRFGGTISEDTTLYAQWEGAENSYTIIYWKQKASDEAGLSDSMKSYDYVESVTVDSNVRTGDNVVLPGGYNTKSSNSETSDYYQTAFGRTDWNSSMTVSADGSTVVNVYYDRKAYHLYFQAVDYVYTVSTNDNDNSPYKYGDGNGQRERIYWKNSAFRTSNSNSGTVYNGTVYTRSNSTSLQTIKDIYGLYGHEIINEFPIVGTNGTTYTAARWAPQTNSVGWKEVMSIVYSVPAGNVTFKLDTSSRPTKTVNYYVEALKGDAGTVSAPAKLYFSDNSTVTTDKKFVLYKSVDMKYNGVTEEDLLDIPGMKFLGTDSTKNANNFWIYSTTASGTLNVYYKRNVGKIDFVSEGAHVRNNNTTTVNEIPYGATIIDYMPAEPSNGMEGYYFDGWYKDQACSEGLELTENDKMPDANAIFYAKWSTFRVRVVLEPGCNDYWFANNQTLKYRLDYGENVSFANIKAGVARRPGYKLTGWYYTPDFREGTLVNTDNPYVINTNTPGVNMNYQSTSDWANNIYGDNDGAHGNVKGLLKLYARWQLDIKEGTVYFLYEVEDGYCIFDASGENQTMVPVDSMGHALETSFQIAEAPSDYIDGVDFTNWMVLNKNGGATSVVYNAGDTVTLNEEEWADFIDTVTLTDADGNVGSMKVVRLRARFTAKEDKATAIVFHGNGGTMDGAESYTQVVPLNATIDLAVQSAAFTREHYSLVAWNTAADGSGTEFQTGQEIYADNKDLGENGANELYAIWQADIEIVASGAEEEVIYDGSEHSNTKAYTFAYKLGDEVLSEAQLNDLGIRVVIADQSKWPVARGTGKGTYTAADITDAQLANLIRIDSTGYHGTYNIKRVYEPAKLIVRDLMLTITNKVAGGFADTKKAFTFRLEKTSGLQSGSYSATITHVIEGTTSEVNLSAGDTFWMRDGDTIRIEGLPKDKTIRFSVDNGDYTTAWTLNGGSEMNGSNAKIELADDSALEVVNILDTVAPTGVTANYIPYMVMLIAALMVLAAYKMKKRQ